MTRPPDVPDARWFCALRLEERVGLEGEPVASDPERGAARLARWRATLGERADQMSEARAASAGITLEQLQELLGESPASLRERALTTAGAVPAWLEATIAAFEPLEADAAAWFRSAAGLPKDEHGTAALLALVEAPVARGLRRIEHAAAALEAPLTSAVTAGLVEAIQARLLLLLERPLAIELQAASMLGTLTSGTSEGRFAEFCEGLRDPVRRGELLLELPVLARQVVRFVDQWVTSSAELLQRLQADREALVERFGDLGPLTEVRSSGSDAHKEGRQVWFVSFGSGARLVYKPRSVAVDTALYELVDRLNASGLNPPLREIAVLNRDTHGWMEFVEAHSCQYEQEVADFHRRLGAWLAVLHVLAASDLHSENIIAMGAHPMPVDHETLLRCRTFEWATESDADAAVVRMLNDTLLATDLLPAPQWDYGLGQVVDHSGMGSAYEHVDVLPMDRMVDVGTDQMRMGVERREPVRHPNRARLGGVAVDPGEYLNEIVDGFVEGSRLLAATPADTLFEQFEGTTVRMVLRPTQFYARLLEDLHHPDSLRDALDAVPIEATLWDELDAAPWREPTLASEVAQLAAGDVPFFASVIGTGDILGADGTIVRGGVIEDGLATARRRLTALADEAHIERNRWMLEATLARHREGTQRLGTPLAGDTALELARDVGERLAHLAIWDAGRERATWLTAREIGDGLQQEYSYVPQSVDSHFYDGLAGIACFLAELAGVTGDAHAGKLSLAAVRTIVDRERTEATAVIGSYVGWAGRIAALTRIGSRLDRPELVDHAVGLVERVERLIEHDRTLDVIAGAAGAIPALLALEGTRPDSGALAAAMRCGSRLATHAANGEGLPFRRGYSHGPAGAVHAFATLFGRTQDEQWRTRALELAAVERTLTAGGWADDDRPGRAQMCAWCHGAAGIALGRLETWHILGDELLLADAVGALEATLIAPRMPSHVLCHGQLGNLETLLRASQLLGEDRWHRAHAEVLEATVADIRRRGACYAHPGNFEIPGLMSGLAGIGYGLLRAAEPDRVPSVLTSMG